MPPATLEAPPDAGITTQPKKGKKPKANGGDSPKGLQTQIDELNAKLKARDQRDKKGKELAALVKKVRMDLAMKEGDKKQLDKAIKGLEEQKERIFSEMEALEDGHFQHSIDFKEPEKKEGKPGPEAWRKFSLIELFAEMGLSPAMLDKICAAEIKGKSGVTPIANLGELVDFQKQHGLTDIKGVGAAAAKKIEDAMEAWWAKHPEMVPKKQLDDAPADLKYLTPADLNLTADTIEALLHPHLLTMAPLDRNEPIPDLHGCVTYQNRKYVVTPGPIMAGGNAGIVEIWPLNEVLGATDPVADEDDSYPGRKVRLDGIVMEIGPQTEAKLVRTGEDPKPIFDPSANRDNFGKPDETIPLKEAMGKKKVRRK